MQRLSRKTTIALLTLLIFSLLMTGLSYTDSSKEYFTFWSLFEFYLLIGVPTILIFGIVASYIADSVKMRKRWRLMLYAAIGSFMIIPFSAYVFGGTNPMFSLIGIFTAVLFFVMEWIVNKYIYRIA